MNDAQVSPPSGLQSVDRALAVLELLAAWGEGGVTEIAAELDVHKSTASRLLGALESRGLVEQVAERGRYVLGFGLVRLASSVSGQLDLTKASRAVTERLADELGETVNVAVLREHYAVNIDQALGPAAVSSHNWVGELTPLHATSSGKVLLAAQSTAERARLIRAAGLPAYTPKTHTALKALALELDEVTEHGLATTVGELEDGLNAIAVPVRDASGTVIAALSASGPDYRFTQQRLSDVAGRMRAAGAELSARLGH